MIITHEEAFVTAAATSLLSNCIYHKSEGGRLKISFENRIINQLTMYYCENRILDIVLLYSNLHHKRDTRIPLMIELGSILKGFLIGDILLIGPLPLSYFTLYTRFRGCAKIHAAPHVPIYYHKFPTTFSILISKSHKKLRDRYGHQ